MSKINDIQNKILQLEGGKYQKMMDSYLYAKFGYSNITPRGSQLGTDKTVKGTPDSYVRKDNGNYIFIEYGTVQTASFIKTKEDIQSCLDYSKTGIEVDLIDQIVCCYTSSRFSAGETEELYSLFKNVTLMGIGEVSYDLYLHYPVLAKDFLDITVDTNQILHDNEFVSKYQEGGFSTSLDMPLLCRDAEKSELLSLLDKHDIILISGKSGTGKTRLALEVCREYAEHNTFSLKCIRQNGLSIYEDLKSAFRDTQDYIVLVDDANQLAHLEHLVRICKDSSRENKMKILLTVRDYSEDLTKQQIQKVEIPHGYELMPLESENIKKVLEDNLGIKNSDIIEHILKIASGNLRLAIMAGICVIEKKFDQINNSFDIYNYYYSDIMEHINKKQILVASLVAFFDSMKLDNQHLAYIMAEKYDIGEARLTEICQDLHVAEIVDIFNDSAVKFGDEAFGNYLIYYVFFIKKWISIYELIEVSFPANRGRVVYTLNTLTRLFATEELINYMTESVALAWRDFFQEKKHDTKFVFIETFQHLIEDEALLFLKNEIDLLPIVETSFLTFDFKKTSNNHTIKSKLIPMLSSYKCSDKFSDVIELILYNLERNSENPMDYYFLIKDSWSIDRDSYKLDYSQEHILIDKLYSHYNNNPNNNLAIFLLLLIENLLKFEFESTEMTSERSMVFHRFGLIDTPSALELRTKGIRILAELYQNDLLKNKILEVLLTYRIWDPSEQDLNIATNDLAEIATWTKQAFEYTNFNECIVMSHLYGVSKKLELPFRSFAGLENNTSFKIYSILTPDMIFEKKWKEREEEKQKNISRLAHTLSIDEFRQFLTIVNNTIDKPNNWNLANSIESLIFSTNYDKDKFSSFVQAYMENDTPFNFSQGRIVQQLIEFMGFSEATKFINSIDFVNKNSWKTTLFSLSPASEINADLCSKTIKILGEVTNYSNIPTLSLGTILKFDNLEKGFAILYVEEMIEQFSEYTYIFSNLLNIYDDLSFHDVYYRINNGENKCLLQDVYTLAMRSIGSYFDYEHKLFIAILELDPSFLKVVVNEELAGGYKRNEESVLPSLWQLENYQDIILEVFSIITEYKETNYISNYYLMDLFTTADKEHEPHIEKWLTDYILENHKDEEKITDIFSAICNFEALKRRKYIATFCEYNNSFEQFKKIRLFPTSFSWSGSEVPRIENDISFLESVSELLKGIEYIEHRAHLADMIRHKQTRKEHVLLEEFLETR